MLFGGKGGGGGGGGEGADAVYRVGRGSDKGYHVSDSV